ncbi:hypothetical protein N7462_008565 [Penicillium macrosclerotiorum]|uniref:uncharacterized protein n=1 Tax=Penicillium macrosclerotiorum TaxID=303699 RepID=UPI0025490927|nr:uncharacterized protein N7462_008565 [Penicillium macrosclerotiorum]KAJ5675668.1 hypothetical protein N7462_008565 [Penicillium macrosclerotiorum]
MPTSKKVAEVNPKDSPSTKGQKLKVFTDKGGPKTKTEGTPTKRRKTKESVLTAQGLPCQKCVKHMIKEPEHICFRQTGHISCRYCLDTHQKCERIHKDLEYEAKFAIESQAEERKHLLMVFKNTLNKRLREDKEATDQVQELVDAQLSQNLQQSLVVKNTTDKETQTLTWESLRAQILEECPQFE